MNRTRSLLALAVLAAPSLAAAAGFSLNEQSIKSLGTALAGRGSSAADATTLYSNPAGMSQLEGTQVSGNMTLIDAPADIENPSGIPATGTNYGDMVPASIVGSSFITTRVNDKLSTGIGFYAPFGLATNYEDSFQGRYFGDKSKVKVVALQPTASLQLAPNLSLGLGVAISKIEGTLSSYVSPLAPGSTLMIEGDDMSTSVNLGALYSFDENTRVGLTYHGRTNYTLTGTTLVSNLPTVTGSASASYDAALDISTPSSWDLSLTHRLNTIVTFQALASKTQWSVLDQLLIRNSGAPALLSTVGEELHWHDSWLYSIGADWQYSDAIILRAGIGHDETPINSAYRSVRVPSNDRDYVTIGISYKISDKLSMDAAYEYIKEDPSKVNVSKPAFGTSYSATYKGTANLLGAQLNLRF